MNPMYVKRGECRDSSHVGPLMRKEAALEHFFKNGRLSDVDAQNKKNKMAASLKG